MKINTIPVGEALAKYFAHVGIDHVFGFPGETSLPFYIGLQKTPSIKHILARCPRCAGYMAEAYARLSCKVGVCDAPGGIGSPFVVPAIHEAYNSSTPLLFLASGTDTRKRQRWTTSTCDQQNIFKTVTKATYLVDNQKQTLSMLKEALYFSTLPRTAPVFFEIPADIFASQVEIENFPIVSVNYPCDRAQADVNLLEKAKQILYQSKSPLIVAGGGVFLSNAVNEVRQLQLQTKIPIVTTLNGKGVVQDNQPGVLGVIGSKGNMEANSFAQQADCILVLGSKLGDKSTNGFAWPKKHQYLIHVDIDAKELYDLGSNYLPVKADILSFVSSLSGLLEQWKASEKVLPTKNIYWEQGLTHHLCQLLSKLLPDDAVLIADASVSSGWAGAAINFTGNQRLLSPRGSGSIGYALPAAIGASFARPHSKIIAIGGDGGLSIAMHEMETVARYQLPIIYFLLNNNRLGLIDKHAICLLNGRAVSDQFCEINWSQIGRSFGWQVKQVRTLDELENVVPHLFLTDSPVLVECCISPDEMAPDFYITVNQKEEK